ncbi:Titin-like protein, partial [Leptotrombidium deliense]
MNLMVSVTGVTCNDLKQTHRLENATPPVFERLPSSVHLVEGGDAHFACRITADPPPQVVWTRRGMVIRNDDRRQLSYDPQTGICSIAIKHLTVDDDGEYTCTAVNEAGEASLTVNIHRQPHKQVK